MKARILFVGHSYHGVTASSEFFTDLLHQRFDVTYISVNPDAGDTLQSVFDVDLSAFEGVVLWQIDRLAPYFISKKVKTIVIPMFDGSYELDDKHWVAMQDALIINFTFELHYKVTQLGCNSIYVKYFPPVPNEESAADRETLSAFFWERRPDTNINANKVIEVFSGRLEHLHIHQAPDPGLKPTVLKDSHSVEITTSGWLPSKRNLLEKIASSHIYIAPRYTEGIGMGFLEAMALGKTVIAHDCPAHNEYISNWKNGILINFLENQTVRSDLPEIKTIGHNAWNDANRWRQNWLEFYQGMCLDAIENFISEEASVESLGSCYFELDCMWQLLQSSYSDLELYYSNLRTLLEPSLTKVHKLERIGDYRRALRCMRSLEEKRPDIDVYRLMKKLLEARVSHKLGR